MTTVGLIGLGAMGSGMAASLRRAGHSVQVFDVRREVAEAFTNAGGTAHESLASLGAACDVIVSVVVNAAHDQRRRQATRARAAEGWGTWEIARQDEIVSDRERLDWLAHAMTQLSPELRDTVALVLGEELTQAQAGEVLGVSEGTVAWRMAEVKKRLRAIAAKEAK